MKLQPCMSKITLVFVVAVSVFAGAIGSHLFSAPAEAQQVQNFGYVVAEGFTLGKRGLVRAQMSVDQADSTVLTLNDPTTRKGLRLVVDRSGNVSITDFNGQPLTASRHQLPPLQLTSASDGSMGKADGATLRDVNTVRDELNAIWRNLTTLQQRVNELSR